MLLKQMQYFVTVVQSNSFTEAAELLFISQSAVSQQIQALERELGVKLIIRENRRFSLTAAGVYFYRHSLEVLEEIAIIRRETIRIAHDYKPSLRIGYLKCYNGQELQQAVAYFSQLHTEISLHIINGTHEELYDLLRLGNVDLVLNDQRRAFSDEYINFEILQCDVLVELSSHGQYHAHEKVTLNELKRMPCILISSKEQQVTEQEYYQNTLGFGRNFLFAETLEEGRLMVVGNRGFLPIENIGTLPPAGTAIKRLPLYRGNKPFQRNYCAFWRKEQTNPYIEEFAIILRKLLYPK